MLLKDAKIHDLVKIEENHYIVVGKQVCSKLYCLATAEVIEIDGNTFCKLLRRKHGKSVIATLKPGTIITNTNDSFIKVLGFASGSDTKISCTLFVENSSPRALNINANRLVTVWS